MKTRDGALRATRLIFPRNKNPLDSLPPAQKNPGIPLNPPPMKRSILLIALLLALVTGATEAADPLRVFIRGGKKSHGPNAHEHERFLNDWKVLLNGRGMKADGAMDWPTAEQFSNSDVVLLYAQEGGNATTEQKANLAEFTKRGGSLVVIHTASVSDDPPWWKSVIGGAWVHGKTKFKEGPMDLYYTENQRLEGGHPITKGASNFHFDDEIYYDMDISPDVRVLATSYTPNVREGRKPSAGGKAHIFDIQPQMWTYERTAEGGTQPYRAFVCIPGHLYSTFEKPNVRAVLLRGIAWAGRRTNLDEFSKPEEIASLTYPEGGPQRPADTLAKLEVHPDFVLKLVAAEPLISKPMNFDWDAAGRLWVAESPEYPNGRRGMRPEYRGIEWKDHGGIDPTPGIQDRKAIDKISILTDTDKDGVMDKREIFYEGLDLVTGLVFYKDGVIVTQAPDVLWLRDTNGDGKADKVEKLYTGLGTRDTHAVINNPRMGWDGWVYCTYGNSGSQDITNGDGTKHFGGVGNGVVRFKPDGSAFEQYSSKGSNTWGLTITGDNRVMWTQPTSGQLLMHTVLPEYVLSRGKLRGLPSYKVVVPSPKSFPAMTWEQIAYVQIDWVGSFTAAAGCVVYDGGSWPTEYNGDYFTTEPTINIIHHQRLRPEASSFSASKLPGREETEFIRSKDMWWRPIEVRVGPDGAVYIGDFYNQAVIHNDTRGPDHNVVNAAVRPDRDHYFGRIWRLDHKQAQVLAVPNLSKAKTADLAKALTNPNAHVRLTASRLLVESSARKAEVVGAVVALLDHPSADARIAALWTAHRLGSFASADSQTKLTNAFKDKDASVRRNAALIAEEIPTLSQATLALLKDPDAGVRVAALRALGASPISAEGATALIAAWPGFTDDFQKSAAIGAAASNPAVSINAALASADPASMAPLVIQLASAIGEKNNSAAAANLIIALADKPAAVDGLKRSILDTLGKTLKTAPALTPELSKALTELFAGGASASALPLAARWDTAGILKEPIAKMTSGLMARLNAEGVSDADRLSIVQSLLGLCASNPAVLPAVVKLASSPISPSLQRQIVVALGETADPSIGAALSGAYAKFSPEAQTAAFEVLLQRAEWALSFLEAVKSKAIDVALVGHSNASRLRTHPDKKVSQEANAAFDQLFGPMLKAKNEVLAKLVSEVEKPGNIVKGKELYTTACAICHKLGDTGADIGPALTGMGAHGAGELLVHIVDPNREVDPSFLTWNIETKSGQFHAGIIARENPTTITLKSLAGMVEIKTSDVKTRVNTGRSLMPEGLEALGAESLRDILAYICGGDATRFRMIDLKPAFTADTRNGLYQSAAMKTNTLAFKKFGMTTLEGIPFNVIDPGKSTTGNNVIVLKGGPGAVYSKSFPQKVEAKVGGFNANRLHFLGAVTGWGFQGSGDPSPVMKVTVVYSDQKTEELVFSNGIEFADYGSNVAVPGSKSVDHLLSAHQIRWFSKTLKRTAPIDKLIMESFNTDVAPTMAAITAELSDGKAPPAAAAPAAAQPAAFVPQFNDALPQPPAQAKGPRVLLVGGGSSHDFPKWYGGTDKSVIGAISGWVDFTQNANGAPGILDKIDVLGWSANQPVSSDTCAALMKFAKSGKGMVIMHPGTWYAWRNFPDWNREVVGGGSNGHDHLGEFEVEVIEPTHPLMAGLPKKFKITDELYNFIPDPKGTPIKVLAQATSPKSGKVFPQVWVVQHPTNSHVVCITLGHDGRAHELPEYQQLIKNAFSWAGGKSVISNQ